MTRALLSLSFLSFACLVAACTGPRPLEVPPVTTARATRDGTLASTATSPPAPRAASTYAGHGADSVPPEVLARFAPTPIPPQVSRRIQAMLDVRAPVGKRLSPDGKSLFFSWNVSGTSQIWKVDGPRRFPVQLTGGEDVARLEGVMPDGKTLVILRDRKGEENPGVYLLDEGGGLPKQVQHTPKVQSFVSWVSSDGKTVWLRANDVKPDSYAIYRYDVATGKRELVFGEPGLWSLAEVQGERLLLQKQTGELTSEWYEYEASSKKLAPLFGQDEKEEYEVAYAAQPGELLVQTPKFGEYRRLFRVSAKKLKGGPLAAGDVAPVTPEMPHDVKHVAIDRAKKRIYASVNDGGFTRMRVFDAKTYVEKALPKIPAADHVTFESATWDGRFAVMTVGTATAPATSHVVDWDAGTAEKWILPSTPEVDTSTFAVAEPMTYPARDGTKIPAFVRRSPACAKPAPGAAPCPVIVSFHGGPEGQVLPGFDQRAQIFVDAGFVWVAPNVRGSDGYGKTWLHADDGPKRLAVVTDIEDAAGWARRTFTHAGKEPKVGVTGGSYGGYSTLVAMTMFAGAYDAGVANVGMSNLLTFLQNTAPYRRALRAAEYGDPEKDRETLLRLSPVTYIDKVKAPLLLVQGASDPRVPIGEAIQMHAALEKRGQATKMIVFPDEGHGAQKRENRVLEIGHTLAFFETHLLGRAK